MVRRSEIKLLGEGSKYLLDGLKDYRVNLKNNFSQVKDYFEAANSKFVEEFRLIIFFLNFSFSTTTVHL